MSKWHFYQEGGIWVATTAGGRPIYAATLPELREAIAETDQDWTPADPDPPKPAPPVSAAPPVPVKAPESVDANGTAPGGL